ncbi:MAG: hypothetical protein IJN38_03440 [Clostridia bacterium]|nr:hypothetical protein [Clostridia bacterium]
MTKKQATNQLVKDIIVAVAATAIIAFLASTFMESDLSVGIIAGIFFSGIPFGWRWLSKIFTALGFLAIVAKLFGAILLGWVALPIVIVKDIIQLAVAAKNEKNGIVSAETVEK